jgi:hypothetical protein
MPENSNTSTVPHLSIDGLDVPLEVAQHVLWHFGDQGLGVQPGSFTTLLLRAAQHADLSNRARLLLGFPEYVAAWRLVADTFEGLQALRLFVQEATR